MVIFTPRAIKRSSVNMEDASIGSGVRELSLWLLVGFGLYLVLALLTYAPQDPGWSYSSSLNNTVVQNAGGSVGAWCADILVYLFGYLAFLFPIAFIWHAILAMYQGESRFSRVYTLPLRWIGFLISLTSGTMLAELYTHTQFIPVPTGPGGVLGQFFTPLLIAAATPLGGVVLLMLLSLIGFTMLSGLSWLGLMDFIGGIILAVIYLVFKPIFWLFERKKTASSQQTALAESDTIVTETAKHDAKLESVAVVDTIAAHTVAPIYTSTVAAYPVIEESQESSLTSKLEENLEENKEIGLISSDAVENSIEPKIEAPVLEMHPVESEPLQLSLLDLCDISPAVHKIDPIESVSVPVNIPMNIHHAPTDLNSEHSLNLSH